MAPRTGRSRRVGLRRVDAAIDALKPMGFSSDVIRRKVKDLLKEYGDEGWVFIEEAAYKLLIECILEDQEQGEPSSRDSPDEARGEGGEQAEPSGAQPLIEGGEELEPSGAQPLIEANEPICSNQGIGLTTPATVEALENSLLAPQPSSSLTEHETNQGKITPSNEVDQTNDIVIDQKNNAALSETIMLCPPGFEQYPPLQFNNGPTKPKRKPCLGWLGPKDDNDFVLLEPAPVLGWNNRPWPRKRKSRWDVSPYD